MLLGCLPRVEKSSVFKELRTHFYKCFSMDGKVLKKTHNILSCTQLQLQNYCFNNQHSVIRVAQRLSLWKIFVNTFVSMINLSKKKKSSRSFFIFDNIENLKKSPTRWNDALLSYTLKYIILYIRSIMYYNIKGNDVFFPPRLKLQKQLKKFKGKE